MTFLFHFYYNIARVFAVTVRVKKASCCDLSAENKNIARSYHDSYGKPLKRACLEVFIYLFIYLFIYFFWGGALNFGENKFIVWS